MNREESRMRVQIDAMLFILSFCLSFFFGGGEGGSCLFACAFVFLCVQRWIRLGRYWVSVCGRGDACDLNR